MRLWLILERLLSYLSDCWFHGCGNSFRYQVIIQRMGCARLWSLVLLLIDIMGVNGFHVYNCCIRRILYGYYLVLRIPTLQVFSSYLFTQLAFTFQVMRGPSGSLLFNSLFYYLICQVLTRGEWLRGKIGITNYFLLLT